MRRILSVVTILAWALWFGGMVALVIFVVRLFATSQETAANAAPVLFRSFAVYQLLVGGIACLAGTGLTLLTRRNAHAIMTLLMIAAFGLSLLIHSWTFEMMVLDRSAAPQMLRFQVLHRRSTHAYRGAAGLLLVAGTGWILTLPPRRKDSGTAVA